MRILILIVALALALASPSAVRCEGPSPGAAEQYRRLARTINMELANETDDWGADLRPEHLEACKKAGFTAIRLPIGWAKHTSPAGPDFTINEKLFRRVDEVVSQCVALGLAVILDNPKDKRLAADPPANRDRFLAITRQIAEHFRTFPPEVMIEPLAEPNGPLNKVWNRYFEDALAVVRRSNPTRVVLVGPVGYNAPQYLKHLRLPPDPNLIVCVHIYVPTTFVFQGETFQGGPPIPVGIMWSGTAQEKQTLAAAYDTAAQWGRTNGRLMFVEEFGSTDKADLGSRARWTAYCRELAQARGMPWGVWGFGPTFSVYDLSKRVWRTELLRSLIPGR